MDQLLLEKLIANCLKMIGKRPQSEKELQDKLYKYLSRKKISGKELYIEAVVEYLTKHNYLNDAEFAKWWVDERERLKPESKRMIQQELHIKGISDEMIESVLLKYDELEACRKVAHKKRKYYSQKELQVYLLHHGFPWDIIKKCSTLTH
jgi:regulatory protein